MKLTRHCLLGLIFATLGCGKSDLNGRIKWREKDRFVWLLNVHQSSNIVLTVDGADYSDIAGIEPYYIPVTGTEKILFMQRPRGGGGVVHIYDLETNEHVNIPVSFIALGPGIGTGAISSHAEMHANDVIIVYMFGKDDPSIVYAIDLKAKTIANVIRE